jgi:glycosyltransferase involved in cell wall biosynthesis
MSDRLVVISPVHSEASHIVKAIAAVLRQARLPDLWVIVDDASTDGTFEIARRATAGADFVHAIRCKPVSISDRDGLAAARDAHAFNVGLAYARTYGEFEYISKLDGDVVLPLDYYELCTKILAEDPTTGSTAEAHSDSTPPRARGVEGVRQVLFRGDRRHSGTSWLGYDR